MDTKQRTMEQACAAALCLAALAGCGLINRAGEREAELSLPEATLSAAYNPDFGIPAVAGIGDIYDIYSVDPFQGPLAGLNPAQLRGVFPNPATPQELATVDGIYTVYFGNNIAPYDTSFSPYISANDIYVTVPPGDAPGFVDVIFRDMETLRDAATLYDGYEYLNEGFNLYDVVPDRGWIFGDESANLLGEYPVTSAFSTSLLGNISGASQYYRVYFDGRLAAFDSTVIDPVITATNMYVRSPFGDAVELVDVTIVSHDNGDFSNSLVTQLQRAYKYYAMYLSRVIPNQGSILGFNTARLEGFLPGLPVISNIYSAYARYGVYFGGNRANFRDPDGPGPTPVFQPSVIVNMAAKIYTIGFMYVEVPPAVVPSFVNVRIEDLESNPDLRDDTTICPLCYQYINESGIGRWTDADILPNPVGKLPAGELLVRITVTGVLTGNNTVFIVPQGGNPGNTAHRIPLTQLTAGDVNGNWVWTGTNTNEISRTMANEALLVDGHAAVYIYDTVNDEIVGDDGNDLSDNNRIEGQALAGRHFIIDTIPPRMRLVPGLARLRGDDFVSGDIPGDWSVTGAVDSAGAPPMPLGPVHPFDYSALDGFPEVPFAGNWMVRPAGINSKAQVFFRVSSLTNFFEDSNYNANNEPTTNLMFNLGVIFEDEDIYNAMGRTPGALDRNRFDNNSTTRLVAGFPRSPVSPQTGFRDEVLVPNMVNQEVLIAWDFQATPFQSPNISGITVNYSTTGSPLAVGGNSNLSSNLDAYPVELTANYTIGDVSDPATGANVQDTGPYSLMSVVFRSVDRAGDYFPRGDTTQGRRKLFTANDTSDEEGYSLQPEVGPLNLWWLRTTATRVMSNVPPSGDAATPEFSWESTGPDTDTVFDPQDSLGVQRLYSFAIYATNGQGTRDEQRDGPYDLISPWSAWDTPTNLTRDQVLAVTSGNEGRWFLIVVMSCDEAGNIEVWPIDQLVNPTGVGPSNIESVNEAIGTEERNWERWFVPPLSQQVDTLVEPYFWHDQGTNGSSPDFDGDGIFFVGEPSFGDAEVIPYPPIRIFNPNAGFHIGRVMGEFSMALSSESGPLGVIWRLSENGVDLFGNVDIIPSNIQANSVSLTLPTLIDAFLGSPNRQPTYYTFTAQAYIDLNGNDAFDGPTTDILDTSPATVQFVVVDNVAEFIQRRKSEDAQPIQETDRPQ